MLINIYNAKTEKGQVSVLNKLISILSNFENINKRNVIFASVFNVFLEPLLDAKRCTPTLKSRPINKLIYGEKKPLKKSKKNLFNKNIYLQLFNDD